MMHGTIPIDFRDRSYNIPVNIWLNHDYPKSAPIIFVVPGPGMSIRTSNHVDIDRRCYHPYLAYWTDDSRKSVLIMAIRCLQDVFSREPPLYTALPEIGNNRPVERSLVGKCQESRLHLEKRLTDVRSPPPRPAKVPQKPEGEQHGSLARQDQSPKRIPPDLPPPPPFSFRNQYQLDDRRREFVATSRTDQANSSKSEYESMENTEYHFSEHHARQDAIEQGSLELAPGNQQRSLLSRIYSEIDDHRAIGLKHHMAEIEAIEQVNGDMVQRIGILKDIEQQLQRLNGATSSNSSILPERLQKARSVIDGSDHSNLKDLDHILVAQNVVYNQLYELVADELGLEDTIYALGKAFEVERIDLDSFLKVSTLNEHLTILIGTVHSHARTGTIHAQGPYRQNFQNAQSAGLTFGRPFDGAV